MKSICILAAFLLLGAGCVSTKSSERQSAQIKKPKVVEAGCGQCLMGMKEKKGCDLAVRFDGNSYFVDGFKMRQFGDPDADDGMCERMHKAKVTGEVVNGRFVAKTFEPLPQEN